MKLEEFITDCLNQIIDGVKNAQDYAKEKGAEVVQIPDQQKIEFDIAVTTKTTEGNQTEGKEAVSVASYGVDTRGKSESVNIAVSRIRFYVPITLATKDGKIHPEIHVKSSGRRTFSGKPEGY